MRGAGGLTSLGYYLNIKLEHALSHLGSLITKGDVP